MNLFRAPWHARAAGLLAIFALVLVAADPAGAHHPDLENDALVATDCGHAGDTEMYRLVETGEFAIAPVPAGVTLETLRFVRPTRDGGTEQIVACLAYPTGGEPTTLVSIAHGNGHTVQLSWSQHITDIVDRANQDGIAVAAVAMNYRDNFGFPALRGAEDLIEVTKFLRTRFAAVDRGVIAGVSMGGSVSGTAIHVADEPLWSAWIAAEPVSNLAESWTEATLASGASEFAARAAESIERETGGTPAEVPDEYALRSPVLHAGDIAAAGVTQASVTHAVLDGLVPYNQGVTLAVALCGAQVGTAFDTITEGQGFAPDTSAFDTVTIGDELDPIIGPQTGHGSEKDPAHPVMTTMFARLDQAIRGEPLDGGCAAAFAAEANPPTPAPTATTQLAASPSSTVAPQSTQDPDALPSTGGTSLAPAALLALALGVVSARKLLK